MARATRVHPVPERPRTPVPRSGTARRLLLVALGGCLLLGLLGLAVNVALVGRLERIEGAFAGLSDRPAGSPGLTFLMVGTRSGGQGGADVPWLEGEQSVEAVMLIDIAPDWLSVQVETLPSSSGATLAARSARPAETVAAVESWSGRRVDHLLAVDWTTFVRLAARDGVDASYAYGSGPAAQREFLEHVLDGALHQELRKHPIELYRVLSTTVQGTAVDEELSVAELDSIAFSLRGLRSHDISFTAARADGSGHSPN